LGSRRSLQREQESPLLAVQPPYADNATAVVDVSRIKLTAISAGEADSVRIH